MIDPSVRHLYAGVEDLLVIISQRLGPFAPPENQLRGIVANVLGSAEVREYLTHRVLQEIQPEHQVVPPPAEPTQPPPAAIRRIRIPVTEAFLTYNLIGVCRDHRPAFPGYFVPFLLETDCGNFSAKITSARQGTARGDPAAGKYIKSVERGDLEYWYNRHPEVTVGSTLLVEIIRPMERYRLSVAQTL